MELIERSEIMSKGSKKTTKKRSSLLTFLVVVIILAVSGFFYVRHQLSPVNTEDKEIQTIEIPTGSTRNDIASILEENELIRSASIFSYYVRFKADASKFHAGYYDFSPAMSVSEIVRELESGNAKDHIIEVTIREGIDIEQIAEVIGKETQFTKEVFIETIQDPEVVDSLVQKYPDLLNEASEAEGVRYVLEGYLFPKTYPVTPDTTIDQLIEQMVYQSHLILEQNKEAFEQSELSVHEIFTLASVIEREGVHEEDRALISGVFHNRLAQNMPLQTDISVLYALHTHKEYITLKDIEVDSPYNTYLYPGLMPGPVNSPSESAIIAALKPENTDYLYFLADIKTGEVYFSETYDEHLELQEKYVPSEAPKDNN